MLLSSYTLPSPTVYVELLTKDSVALAEAEGKEVGCGEEGQPTGKSNTL